MKKLLIFIAVMLWTTLSFAQSTTMTSVLGIEFGSKRQQVKEIITSKQPTSTLYSEKEISMTYENVKWGEYKTMLVIFQFTDDDKLHTVMIFLDPDHCKNVFYLYDKVIGTINERYYQTTKSTEHYSYPYTRSDKYKYTESMVKNDRVTMQSLWAFDTRNTPSNDEDDNNISVMVTDDCVVKVTYQDGVLIDEVIEKQKAKNSQDY
jgi:hypothetical protein